MSDSLFQILSGHYPASQYALLEEVSYAAGFSRSNSCDYMAIGLWPSRGLHLTGIEVKSFRGDWLRELKNPKKAENHFKYCDFWYLLTTEESVAKLEEIPATWGWKTVSGKKIRTMKEAPIQKPEALDRSFLAALLKRAAQVKDGYIRRDSVEDRLEQAREKGKESANRDHQYEIERHNELRKHIEDFEEKSGIKITSWDRGKIASAVKFIVDGGLDQQQAQLYGLRETAKKVIEKLSTVLDQND